MRTTAQFRPDLTPFEANAAAMRVWLVTILSWLIEHCDALGLHGLAAQFARQVRGDLREAAHDLRRIIFLKAFVRLRLDMRARSAPAFAAAPAGVRRQARRGGARCFLASVRGLNSGTPLERARRLKEILDNPEPYIARMRARMIKLIGRLRTTSLVIASSPRDRLSTAPAQRIICADTS